MHVPCGEVLSFVRPYDVLPFVLVAVIRLRLPFQCHRQTPVVYNSHTRPVVVAAAAELAVAVVVRFAFHSVAVACQPDSKVYLDASIQFVPYSDCSSPCDRRAGIAGTVAYSPDLDFDYSGAFVGCRQDGLHSDSVHACPSPCTSWQSMMSYFRSYLYSSSF